jgi:hypothetical protein
VKGYRLIDLSSKWLIIKRSVSCVPQQPHVYTYVLPPVRDDEHAHVNSSSNESYDLEDSDDLDTDSIQSDENLVHADAYVDPESRP